MLTEALITQIMRLLQTLMPQHKYRDYSKTATKRLSQRLTCTDWHTTSKRDDIVTDADSDNLAETHNKSNCCTIFKQCCLVWLLAGIRDVCCCVAYMVCLGAGIAQ